MAKTRKRNKRNRKYNHKQNGKLNSVLIETDSSKFKPTSSEADLLTPVSVNVVQPVVSAPKIKLQTQETPPDESSSKKSTDEEDTVKIPALLVTPKSTSQASGSEIRLSIKRIDNSRINQVSVKSKSTQKNCLNFDDNKINGTYFTPVKLTERISTPLAKVSPLNFSTPKNARNTQREIRQRKVGMELSTSHKDIKSLTPIKRTSIRLKRDRWSFNIFHLFYWLHASFRRSYIALRKYIYGIQNESETEYQNPHCVHCKAEIEKLKSKIKSLEAELLEQKMKLQLIDNIQKEFEELKAQIKNKSEPRREISTGLPPPPPPPPPLPPMSFLNSDSTVISRSYNKPLSQKNEKNLKENIRPIITVEQLSSVKLRKITEPSVKKKTSVYKSEDFLHQVKLRPLSKTTPTTIIGSSPKSSLTRILKNVDTSVCSIRRIRKTQFLSSDDISRFQSLKNRPFFANDSAPNLTTIPLPVK